MPSSRAIRRTAGVASAFRAGAAAVSWRRPNRSAIESCPDIVPTTVPASSSFDAALAGSRGSTRAGSFAAGAAARGAGAAGAAARAPTS